MTHPADVVVVGAGLAGMRAALAAEEAGARVALVDRGPIGTGTNSALSGGGFLGPMDAEQAEEYVRSILALGHGLNRAAYVRRMAEEAPAAIAFLHSLGLEITSQPRYWRVRSPRPQILPGTTLVRRVADRVLDRPAIRTVRGLRMTALLSSPAGILGVRGIDLRGEAYELRAPAVILACGGAGAIYAKHDNQATILGQGYHLAAGAGLRLWDMEFVQFYPLVLDEPGWPVTLLSPPFPSGARVLGPGGEDILQTHGLGKLDRAVMETRDTFSALLVEAAKAGPVRLDLRAVAEEEWGRYPLSLLGRLQAHCQAHPIRVTPGAHFCMGGVRTDGAGQTDLPGLFACGEVVWGLHGANRVGGNALLECLVSGAIAGRGAAAFARSNPGSPERPRPGESRASGSKATLDLPALRRRIREAAWRFAGVVRSEEGMAQGLTEAEATSEALAAVAPHTPKDRILRDDLLSAAFVLRAILTAGLPRRESRGAFIRADYPAQDDGRWRKNSCLAWDASADQFTVTHHPADAGEK